MKVDILLSSPSSKSSSVSASASVDAHPAALPPCCGAALMQLPWETRLLLDIWLLRLRDASEYLPVYHIANGYHGIFDDP